MPSASDALRSLMEKWFGDPIDDGPPHRFLTSRGWTERSGMWKPPVPAHNPSREEICCLCFLRDEWDYDFSFMTLDYERGYVMIDSQNNEVL